jgi:hypothetical protein
VFYSSADRIVVVGEGGLVLTQTLGGATTVAGENQPLTFGLSQNYPNPFNPSTTIEFQIPAATTVRIAVYDMLGREVGELMNGVMDAGVHSVLFDAGRMASGVYYCRMTAGTFSAMRTMIVLK